MRRHKSTASPTQPTQRINKIQVESHRMIKALNSDQYEFKRIKHATLKYHCVILLPPINLLNDIEITPSFLMSHIVILDISHKFVSLNLIPGYIENSTIKIYNKLNHNLFHYQRILNEITEMELLQEQIHEINCNYVDSLYLGNSTLNVIHVNNVVLYNGCDWAWKHVNIYDITEYHIETIIMDKVSYIQKNISQSVSLQYLKERKNMLNTETIIYRIIHLDNMLLKEINNFILKYPLMVKSTSLEERKRLIDEFCDETYQKLRVINTYSIMDQQALQLVLKRIITVRLYPYLWQPSITLLENKQFSSIDKDFLMSNLMQLHKFINLRHLGLNDKEIPLYNDIISFLHQINSLRSPNDKVEYLKGIHLLIEEISKSFFTINDKQTVLKYFIIKSQIQHLPSTLEYIQMFSNRSDKQEVIDIYSEVVDYCLSLDQKSLYISDESYAEEISKYPDQTEIIFESVPLPLTDIQLLNLMNFTQNRQTMTVDHLFHMNVEDIQKEDIAIIIDLIKRLNQENIDLKKFIESHSK